MRRSLLLVGVLAMAIAMVAAVPASSAPQAKTYARVLASGSFLYAIDYGSHPDSVFNGKYSRLIWWQVNAIVAYAGRTLTALSGSMLAEGGASVSSNMTEWNGPSSRVPVRCNAPGSFGGRGKSYITNTDGGRVSGGGGVGVSSSGGLTVNPGRAIKWSIGCAATESLETHGLPGGPGFRLPAPRRSQFEGSRTFSSGCKESYQHDWDPARDVPGAHTFQGHVQFVFHYARFPASELKAARMLQRDRVSDDVKVPSPKKSLKSCP